MGVTICIKSWGGGFSEKRKQLEGNAWKPNNRKYLSSINREGFNHNRYLII